MVHGSRQALSVLIIAALALALAPGCERSPGKVVLRIGHFPNITHAQGVIGNARTRQGEGWFEKRLGKDVEVRWVTFNAGPSAMEAILGGALDITYVGPSPALNGYVRTKGEEIRLVRGSAIGGSALVVQGDGRIKAAADFRGKKVATPQYGNTQDVACRAWLKAQGFQVTQTGGDVRVLPMENPEQLAAFRSGDVDAVWTVEPWVSRLLLEANGKIFLEEPKSVTTVLAASARFLRERKDLVDAVCAAHDELTEWILKNPEEAQRTVKGELEAELRMVKEMPAELVKQAWSRLTFTSGLDRSSLDRWVKDAKDLGFIPPDVDLARLVEKLSRPVEKP
jgi:NitT/TauT family transport system substrate-binding protein